MREHKNRLPCGRPRPALHSMAALRSLQNKLSLYIRNQDLKKSDAREKIFEIIFKNPRHFSIQELVSEVRRLHPNVGAATVYRNVNLLVQAEVIKETLVTETGDTLYELTDDGHHDHIVCLDCHSVFEFHEKVIEQAQDNLGKRLGFNPVNHRHIIFAKCSFKKI